jgi:Iron-sulfur cluster-binding domain
VRPERSVARVKACRDPWTQVNVRANGDVMPCCHSLQRMGTLTEATMEEIWSGPGFVAFRRFLLSRTPLPVCEQCFVRGWRPAPGVPIGQRLRHAAEWTTTAVGLSEGKEVVPLLQLNKLDFRPSDDLHVAVGLKVGNTARARRIDLFVFAETAGGQRYWIRFAGRMTIVVPELGPALPDFEPFSFDGLELLRMPLASVPAGAYRLFAVATLAGGDPDDRTSRLGQTETAFSLSGSPEGRKNQLPRATITAKS